MLMLKGHGPQIPLTQYQSHRHPDSPPALFPRVVPPLSGACPFPAPTPPPSSWGDIRPLPQPKRQEVHPRKMGCSFQKEESCIWHLFSPLFTQFVLNCWIKGVPCNHHETVLHHGKGWRAKENKLEREVWVILHAHRSTGREQWM